MEQYKSSFQPALEGDPQGGVSQSSPITDDPFSQKQQIPGFTTDFDVGEVENPSSMEIDSVPSSPLSQETIFTR